MAPVFIMMIVYNTRVALTTQPFTPPASCFGGMNLLVNQLIAEFLHITSTYFILHPPQSLEILLAVTYLGFFRLMFVSTP